MTKRKDDIIWLEEPRQSNYPAAQSYLTLIYSESAAENLVQRLLKSPMSRFKAKDIFRASGLSLLGVSNERVERDKKKIADGEPLSPLLLVRNTDLGKVVIADGYHRLCAIYTYDEDATIPCKIV